MQSFSILQVRRGYRPIFAHYCSTILLGDFNGHNILWGNKENNSRGELIETFITNNNICLMNDKSNTYMHYPTGSFSSIDLSLCHPSLFLDFNWSVCTDQHHSDHFPIVIKSNTSTVEDHSPKWKLNKANWEVFQSLCTDTFLRQINLFNKI